MHFAHQTIETCNVDKVAYALCKTMSNTISFNLTVTHELKNLPLEALSFWFSPLTKSSFAMQEMVFMRTKCNRMEDFLALRNHMQSTSMLVQSELP